MVSGTVKYKKPGSNVFVELTGTERLPEGTIIDATNGVAKVTSSQPDGTVESANFWLGMFRIDQYAFQPAAHFNFGLDKKKPKPRKPKAKAKKELVTQVSLVGGDFSSCKSAEEGAGRREQRLAASEAVGQGQGQVPHEGPLQLRNRARHYVVCRGRLRRDAHEGEDRRRRGAGLRQGRDRLRARGPQLLRCGDKAEAEEALGGDRPSGQQELGDLNRVQRCSLRRLSQARNSVRPLPSAARSARMRPTST